MKQNHRNYVINGLIVLLSGVITVLFFDFMLYLNPVPVQPVGDPLLVLRHNPEKLRLDSFYVQRYVTTEPLTADEIFKNLPGNFPASIIYCVKDKVEFPYEEFCKQHDRTLRGHQWFSYYENEDNFFDELTLRIRMKSDSFLTKECKEFNSNNFELPVGWIVVGGCKKPRKK